MERKIIQVPKGVRYLGTWEGFSLDMFPKKCIINKQLPGCGFTEWCISGYQGDLILCSPRKVLLHNKWEQHKGEVYLVVNEMEKEVEADKDISIDPDKTNRPTSTPEHIETKEEALERMKKEEEDNKRVYDRLREEMKVYCSTMASLRKPRKILITYDSYRIAKDLLTEMGIYHYFVTMIDEFQSILHDSRFKSDTEISFLDVLKDSPTSYFVSATPMMDKYLEMLDEFKDLPYFELDWATLEPERITIPKLDVRVMRTTTEEACKVVREFLDGKFEEVTVIRDDKPVKIVSNKIVIYVNSVKHIASIIKRTELTPDRVNIICSNTPDNLKKLRRKLGKKFQIGKVPLENEPEPDITFCTRTVYLGADFKSKCARTFIFSDSNLDCLAVDISEDLPQILGRQRLEENPWKNQATFYYRSTADYRNYKKEDFDKKIESKMKWTNSLLDSYDTIKSIKTDQDSFYLANTYRDNARAYYYKKNYVAVNKKVDSITGETTFHPLLNKLVLVSEIRAFNIQQIDYRDRFTVFAAIKEKVNPDLGEGVDSEELVKFIGVYQKLTNIKDKLKLICEQCPDSIYKTVLGQLSEADSVRSYLEVLGRDKIKATGYNLGKMNKAMNLVTFNMLALETAIHEEFKEGSRLSKAIIKNKLKDIYKSLNYNSNPKATDLGKFFELKDIVILEDGKRVKGFELIKKKKL